MQSFVRIFSNPRFSVVGGTHSGMPWKVVWKPTDSRASAEWSSEYVHELLMRGVPVHSALHESDGVMQQCMQCIGDISISTNENVLSARVSV